MFYNKVLTEAFKITVGGRNTQKELFVLIKKELSSQMDSLIKKDVIYRDILEQGMEEAIEWYIDSIGKEV